VSDYINLFVIIAHIICNHPLELAWTIHNQSCSSVIRTGISSTEPAN